MPIGTGLGVTTCLNEQTPGRVHRARQSPLLLPNLAPLARLFQPSISCRGSRRTSRTALAGKA